MCAVLDLSMIYVDFACQCYKTRRQTLKALRQAIRLRIMGLQVTVCSRYAPMCLSFSGQHWWHMVYDAAFLLCCALCSKATPRL